MGAIERVRIDRSTLEPRFKVIGSDLWSDDAGFAAATAEIEIAGVCGSGIVEVIAELFLSGVIAADGTIVQASTQRLCAAWIWRDGVAHHPERRPSNPVGQGGAAGRYRSAHRMGRGGKG